MNARLTQEEIRLATKYIDQYEKTISMWRWARWIMLLVALLNIYIAVSYYNQAGEIEELNTSEQILEDRELITEVLDKYINVRINLLREEMSLNIKIIFPLLLGGWFLGIFIVEIFGEKRKKLLVKVMRHMLEQGN